MAQSIISNRGGFDEQLYQEHGLQAIQVVKNEDRGNFSSNLNENKRSEADFIMERKLHEQRFQQEKEAGDKEK